MKGPELRYPQLDALGSDSEEPRTDCLPKKVGSGCTNESGENMRVATEGCGPMCANLLRQFLDDGHECVVYDRS